MYSFIRPMGQGHSSSDDWSILVDPYGWPGQAFLALKTGWKVF